MGPLNQLDVTRTATTQAEKSASDLADHSLSRETPVSWFFETLWEVVERLPVTRYVELGEGSSFEPSDPR